MWDFVCWTVDSVGQFTFYFASSFRFLLHRQSLSPALWLSSTSSRLVDKLVNPGEFNRWSWLVGLVCSYPLCYSFFFCWVVTCERGVADEFKLQRQSSKSVMSLYLVEVLCLCGFWGVHWTCTVCLILLVCCFYMQGLAVIYCLFSCLLFHVGKELVGSSSYHRWRWRGSSFRLLCLVCLLSSNFLNVHFFWCILLLSLLWSHLFFNPCFWFRGNGFCDGFCSVLGYLYIILNWASFS